MPAVAMHSAVSGTLPLVEGFLGLGEGWDTRKPYSGGSWGQLGLGGRGLCLGGWGAGQGIGHGGDPAARQGGTWACPWSWLSPVSTASSSQPGEAGPLGAALSHRLDTGLGSGVQGLGAQDR